MKIQTTLQNFRRPTGPALLLGLLLSGCATSGREAVVSPQGAMGVRPPEPALGLEMYTMPNLSHMPGTLDEQGPFTCAHEKARSLHPDVDALFRHAHWLWTHNPKALWRPLLEDEALSLKAERLYRIAAAWGHAEAADALWPLEDGKEIVKGALLAGGPLAYARVGIEMDVREEYAAQLGRRPKPAKQKVALQYVRKAADLGSPFAQVYLGKKLFELGDGEPALQKIGMEMLSCAARQGNNTAAFYAALHLQRDKQYDEALKFFQRAFKAGIPEAATALSAAFGNPSPEHPHYMGLAGDAERSARYYRLEMVFQKLMSNGEYDSCFANENGALMAAELDKILPLPPAPLPEWDREIECPQKPPAPPLPSEARIQLMALQKGLEPRTGRTWPHPLQTPPPFACAHERERIAPREVDADKLFQRAEWLHKKNLAEKDSEVYAEVERLYRIATAWGHDKAAENLAQLIVDGHTAYGDFFAKPVEIAQALIHRGIPAGFRLMSLLLEEGHGLKNNPKASGQYLWAAINLGDSQAQSRMGRRGLHSEVLQEYGFHPPPAHEEVARAMQRCAAEQGDADAAYAIAHTLQQEENNSEALQYFHMALKAGEMNAAQALAEIFSKRAEALSGGVGEREEDFLWAVFQMADEKGAEAAEKWRDEFLANAPERADTKARALRYGQIFQMLSDTFTSRHLPFPRIQFSIDELEQIAPLPPATLPTWDGKIQFVENWRRHEAPPLPSEARMEEMARQKGLDAKTGWPLKKDAK